MDVEYLEEALEEFGLLPATERNAIANAVAKLEALDERLSFPHCSAVQGTPKAEALWELRPRRGRSPFRALYCRVGDVWVIAGIAPEAQKDQPGFDRAVRLALERLAADEAEGDE